MLWKYLVNVLFRCAIILIYVATHRYSRCISSIYCQFDDKKKFGPHGDVPRVYGYLFPLLPA